MAYSNKIIALLKDREKSNGKAYSSGILEMYGRKYTVTVEGAKDGQILLSVYPWKKRYNASYGYRKQNNYFPR